MTQSLEGQSPLQEEQTESSQPSRQESAQGPLGGLFDRFFSSGKRNTPSQDSPATSENEGRDDAPASPAPPEQSTQPLASEPVWTPPTSKADYDKAVQAEVDRRADVQRRRSERELSQTVRQTQDRKLLELEQQKDEAINDGDLARAQQIGAQQRVILAQRKQGEWVQNTITEFDRHTLLPLFEGLDQKDVGAIVSAIQDMDPLPGRAHAVKEALKLHDTRIRADERKKTRQRLLKDESFWIEMQGGRESGDEVEHVEGRAGRNGSTGSSAGNALQQLLLGHRGG